ncbi:MAG TPA: glycosyltransferase [Candidatus Brocadiia bacterium]|nr:glycosyltransferase [Planctomycetota bacterium]MDO8094374.1 glycosyltransferase [Candidatus Brocadiales bacterium]
MKKTLLDYLPIVGEEVINELKALAQYLQGKVIQHINSTAVGGGVAEILSRLVPLSNELGVNSRWDVFKGGDAFFQVTKEIHNMLHGKEGTLTDEMKELFLDETQKNIESMEFSGDIMFVHDPQPVGLVSVRNTKPCKWIWRCHIDLSNPNPSCWDFIRPFVEKYDASIFTAPFFAQKLPIREFLIQPSIDPLSDKNKELPPETIMEVLERFQIDHARPIVTQVSRFDYLKDPLGVIDAYRIVKKRRDCQLVLAGGSAADDPESSKVLSEVQEKAKGDPDIHILDLPPTANIEINALQRASTVIVQKSIKEGFGLTVTEALWKGKPVIGGMTGGIPLQIKNKVNGFLVHTIEGTANAIKFLLANPLLAQKMGKNGQEYVRHNFLLTRHLKDYLILFILVDRSAHGVVYL